MKKQLFLALSLTALSLLTINCSSSNNEDDTPVNNPQPSNPQVTPYFHPPVWIQGTWGVSNSTTAQKIYKFTTQDFVMLVTGTEQSMTGIINSTPKGASTSELINENEYKFSINYKATGTVQSFEFKKISATQIQWKDNVSNTWNTLIKF
ncbi:MAG: hypothetical protein ACN6OB_22755 [Chryseobacterium jejuense]|uniref:hypothetical protein n=1 Tax=Chryseobacterium jejuense TaxID=445960 RepID=UPI003D121DFF